MWVATLASKSDGMITVFVSDLAIVTRAAVFF